MVDKRVTKIRILSNTITERSYNSQILLVFTTIEVNIMKDKENDLHCLTPFEDNYQPLTNMKPKGI